MILFDGRLLHLGASYGADHARLHVYVDHVGHGRIFTYDAVGNKQIDSYVPLGAIRKRLSGAPASKQKKTARR